MDSKRNKFAEKKFPESGSKSDQKTKKLNNGSRER